MTLTRIAFSFLLACFLLIACSKDDDPTPVVQPPAVIPDSLGTGWQRISSENLGRLIQDVFFVNKDTGYACGDKFISKSTDGGLTWTKINLPADMLSNLVNMFFLDANHGWIIGSGGTKNSFLIKTTDGGNSWKKISIQPDSIGLNDIQFLNPRLGYMTTSKALMRSIDSGNTWKPILFDNPSSGNGLCFIDSSRGWLSDYQKVLYTQNAGDFIQYQLISTTIDMFFNIQFTDAKHGWIAGTSGLWKTSNEGAKWELVKPAAKNIWADLHFFDQNKGYVMEDSAIYKTTDGGVSFTKVVNLAHRLLVEIHFTDEHHGWAVGQYTFLRYNE